jgi:cysteinyl-tRNA synthetase
LKFNFKLRNNKNRVIKIYIYTFNITIAKGKFTTLPTHIVSQNNVLCLQAEETIIPYLNILADFREKVRGHARVIGAKDILRECDSLRDEVLPNVGVRLEDEGEGSRRVKLVDREEYLKERELKKRQEAERLAEKERKLAIAAAAVEEREAQSRIPPKEMFLHMTDKYSLFDESVR